MPDGVIMLAIACAGLAALAISRRFRRNRVTEPCCAACRYPIKGLPAPTCPECGSDLRTVGVLYPQPMPVTGRIFILTVIGLFGRGGMDAALDDLLPVRRGSSEHVYFTCDDRSVGISLASYSWMSERSSPVGLGDHLRHTIEVWLPGDESAHRLTTSDPDASFETETPDGRRVEHDGPVNAKSLATWLEPFGLLNTVDPPEDLPTFLDEILRISIDRNVMSAFARDRLESHGAFSNQFTEAPSWYTWRTLATTIFWALLWMFWARWETHTPRARAQCLVAACIIVGVVASFQMVGRVLPERYEYEMDFSMSHNGKSLLMRNTARVWETWDEQLHQSPAVCDERMVALRSPDRAVQQLIKHDAEAGYATRKGAERPVHHDGPLDQIAVASWLRTIEWREDEQALQQDAATVLSMLDAGVDWNAAKQSIHNAGGLGRSSHRIGSTWRTVGFLAFWGTLWIVLAIRVNRRTSRGVAFAPRNAAAAESATSP